jgi:hypothetical protein
VDVLAEPVKELPQNQFRTRVEMDMIRGDVKLLCEQVAEGFRVRFRVVIALRDRLSCGIDSFVQWWEGILAEQT